MQTYSEFCPVCDIESLFAFGNNIFDTKKIARRVRKALDGKTPIALYFGFNPASYKGDVVVLTDVGYVFVPIEESLALVGGAWSYLTFLTSYYAQKRLSAFLTNLGEMLNIKVVDRCLYGPFLTEPIFREEELEHQKPEDVAFCLEKQKEICEKYKEQLDSGKNFDSYWSYHNQGFEFRYIPSIEINNAIKRIYEQRKTIEQNGSWAEAKKVILQLHNLLYTP